MEPRKDWGPWEAFENEAGSAMIRFGISWLGDPYLDPGE